MIYKSHQIEMQRNANESSKEFAMRTWFVLKSIHLTHEYGTEHKHIALQDLVHLSNVHIKKNIYGCTFHEKLTLMVATYEANLYV